MRRSNRWGVTATLVCPWLIAFAENLGNGATAKWRFLVRDSRSACVFTERKRCDWHGSQLAGGSPAIAL